MPIVIPKDIPAFDILTQENIFVMGNQRAEVQDIRPLEIAIVNLMPTKEETETQLMRLLSNSPLQVNVTLLTTASYRSTHVLSSHMDRFYVTVEDIKGKYFDGLIVTGAPVETLEFNEVKYWEELCEIMAYAERFVTSTVYICWGAQAALQYHFDIGKMPLPKKLFGVFENRTQAETDPLMKGLDDLFYIPHSRYTTVDARRVRDDPRLVVLAEGEVCGLSILKSIDNRKFFFFGHAEYDRETLKKEYLRDLEKGIPMEEPANYFDGSPDKINMRWKSTANLLFYNWLNYYVYQVTPYRLGDNET